MNGKTIVDIISISIIGVILVSSVLTPFIVDFTDDSVVKYNNSDSNFAITSDGTHSVEWSGGESYTVDGVEISTTSNRPIFISDKIALIWLSIPSIQVFYYDPDTGNPGRIVNASVLTCNINNNDVTINYTIGETSSSMTEAVSWGFIRTTTGDYSFIDSTNKDIYYNDVSQIYSVAYATNGTSFISFNGDETYPSGSVDFNGTKLKGTKDVYSTTRSSIVVTSSNGDTYSTTGIIVPKEIDGLKEPNHTIAVILSIIPIVAIVSILVAIIRTSRT